VNGGFETPGFAGWTVDRAGAGSLLFEAPLPRGGTEAAWFGAVSGFDDAISQTLVTTPGMSYDVTFWLAHGATDASNAFDVWWGDKPLLQLTNAGSFAGSERSFTVTATSDSTVLEFDGRDLRDYYYLDDVTVTAVPIPTPEPGTLLMVGLGVAVVVRSRWH
jgi:PEP-CTERM motif